MKISEIRALSVADMEKQLGEKHRELLDLRFRVATKQLVNNREVLRARRDIARLNTVLREKELGIR
ncbi:MAG: 50S ribosomal protein L29 [Chloroflexota bacterium]